jgi:hypothetical protein
MVVMEEAGLNAAQVLGLMLLSFTVMLVLESVFIRLLFRGKKDPEEAYNNGQKVINELSAAGHGLALPEAMSSVTEHTTRTFEPVYHEEK